MTETLTRQELAELTDRHPIWIFDKIPEIKKHCKGTRKINGEWRFPMSAIEYIERNYIKRKKGKNLQIDKRFANLILSNDFIRAEYFKGKNDQLREIDILKKIILNLSSKIKTGEIDI